MIKRFLPVILLLTVLPYIFPVNAQEVVRIGVSLSLSGKYKEMGSMQHKSFKLWEKHANSRGGIMGKPVRVLFYDDESNGEHARKIYRDMIEKDHVDLVFGPYSSEISAVVMPVIESNHYPVLLSGASSDKLWQKGYKYAFGVYTPASKYAVGFLQMMVKNKYKNIAIVSSNDSFSKTLSDNTVKWAKKFRLNIILFERFRKGTADLTDFALRVKSAQAQALIVCGHLDESVNMRTALKKVNWYPKAYYASVGPATQEFKRILGDDADLTFSSSQWEETVGIHFPGGKEFIKAFHDEYQAPPSYHAATAYASGMILEAALANIQTIDRKQLRDKLSAMDMMTVIGRYGVDRTGMQIRHFPLIIQWQEGVKKVVWPEKLKETDPLFK